MKCNALGKGFCPSRQGRVLTASEEKAVGVEEREFCLHLEDGKCVFELKGKVRNEI